MEEHASPGRLLRQLPAIYQEAAAEDPDSSLAPFLAALEAVLFDGAGDHDGVAAIISGLPLLLSADTPREAFLPWLATWVGLTLHPDLPLATQRTLLRRAVPLYQRRGTRRGLQELLDVVTAGAARVVEPESAGFRVGDARVGSTTRIGRDRPHYFQVVMRASADGSAPADSLLRLTREFIDHAKPAHTYYRLTVASRDTRRRPGDR
jgi:phage tail-like protein